MRAEQRACKEANRGYGEWEGRLAINARTTRASSIACSTMARSPPLAWWLYCWREALLHRIERDDESGEPSCTASKVR